MLSKLIELKEMIGTHTDKAIIEYIDKLIEHEEEQERILLNKCNKTLNGYKAAMKVLKSKHVKNRPILQKAHQYTSGVTVFTDTIQAYQLNDNRYNLPLGDGINYPNMTPIFKSACNYEPVDLPSITDLKIAIEKKEPHVVIGDAWLNPQLLLNAYAILGDVKGYYSSPTRPIRLENKDGELGIVLPLRKGE